MQSVQLVELPAAQRPLQQDRGLTWLHIYMVQLHILAHMVGDVMDKQNSCRLKVRAQEGTQCNDCAGGPCVWVWLTQPGVKDMYAIHAFYGDLPAPSDWIHIGHIRCEVRWQVQMVISDPEVSRKCMSQVDLA